MFRVYYSIYFLMGQVGHGPGAGNAGAEQADQRPDAQTAKTWKSCLPEEYPPPFPGEIRNLHGPFPDSPRAKHKISLDEFEFVLGEFRFLPRRIRFCPRRNRNSPWAKLEFSLGKSGFALGETQFLPGRFQFCPRRSRNSPSTNSNWP